jgi:hypothetical protein
MKKPASRSAQYPLMAEFAYSFNEYVQDSADQVKKTFGAAVTNTGTATAVDPVSGAVEPGLTSGTAVVFDCIPMPVGAVITGGELIVDTAYVGIGAGATISVGIAGDTAALISAYDIDAALVGARTALTLTKPLLCNAGQNVRLTVAGMAATASAGKVRVRVQYTIDGRTSEVQVN